MSVVVWWKGVRVCGRMVGAWLVGVGWLEGRRLPSVNRLAVYH